MIMNSFMNGIQLQMLVKCRFIGLNATDLDFN